MGVTVTDREKADYAWLSEILGARFLAHMTPRYEANMKDERRVMQKWWDDFPSEKKSELMWQMREEKQPAKGGKVGATAWPMKELGDMLREQGGERPTQMEGPACTQDGSFLKPPKGTKVHAKRRTRGRRYTSMSISVTYEFKRLFVAYCERRDLPMSRWIVEAVKQRMDRDE